MMAALPGFRSVDTYKAYRLQERNFTAWLKETGEKLGHQFSKSKNKGNASEHSIPVSDIPSVAELIISQGQPLPGNLRYVFQDVISHSKKALAYYNPKAPEDQVREEE